VSLVEAARIVRTLARSEPGRTRRLWTAAALLMLPAAAALLLAGLGRWGAGVFDQLLEIDLAFLAPFLPAMLLGATVGDELDRGTAGFLFVRPAPRAALLLGKLAAVLPALLTAAAASLVLGFVALHARFPEDLPRALPHLATAAVVVLGGILLYSVLALGAGAAFRKRPVAALLVLLVLDGALAHAPVMLRLVAPAHHLRTLAGLPDAGTIALPFSLPRAASAVYLLALIAAAAWFGVRRIERIEMTGESG
jgi:ABC-type transport system involved in multi-copper enzyme maturation permease subunit